MSKFNPLLDKPKREQPKQQLTASDSDLVPLSPVSGKPMVFGRCRDVPVWVDAENRLILPHRKN